MRLCACGAGQPEAIGLLVRPRKRGRAPRPERVAVAPQGRRTGRVTRGRACGQEPCPRQWKGISWQERRVPRKDSGSTSWLRPKNAKSRRDERRADGPATEGEFGLSIMSGRTETERKKTFCTSSSVQRAGCRTAPANADKIESLTESCLKLLLNKSESWLIKAVTSMLLIINQARCLPSRCPRAGRQGLTTSQPDVA